MSNSPGSARLSRRQLLRGAGIVCLAAACGGPGPQPAITSDSEPPGRVAYTGGQVYRSGKFGDATVVVEHHRIIEVLDSDTTDVDAVDIEGLWLIPGFVDTHVHLQFAAAAEILAGGVTTVRDLGSPAGVAHEAGRSTPLRVVAAGRILTTVGGYPSQTWGADGTARQVRGDEDAVAAVGEQVAAGASFVKIALEPAGGDLFDPGTLDAIVGGAHDAGLKVTAHVGSADALRLAIEHGVDELAHLPLHDVSPTEMAEAAVAGMVLVPTLEIRGRDSSALRAVESFLAAGGTVVYGTDLGNTGTAPGIERTELSAMLDAGMAPAAALDAATLVAGDHLGREDLGRIAAGSVADLVGLRGNPLEDVTAYDEVAMVVAGGTRVLG